MQRPAKQQPPWFALIAVLILPSTCVTASFSFASIGDWGCVPIGGWHEQDQLIVAKQFMASAGAVSAKFVLNTGDNFYYCGVQNGTSDPMWDENYESIYNQQSVMVPWYGCLGNHDYGYPGSAETQMEYRSPNNDRWQIPGRYYYRRLTFSEVNISLVVLDASPCQSDYVNDDPKYWDPCGSVIPGCPGCTFHQNVIKQSCALQKSWLQGIVPTIPSGDWKIVMIHAPATDIDVEDLVSVLQGAKFDLYINGHVHLLTHYQIDGSGTYITTGAGCMVRVQQALEEKKAGITLGTSSCTRSSLHTCTVIFEDIIAGYTTHTFSSDYQTLSTYFYDYSGNLLHTAVTKKGSGPSPNPPPSPPSPNSGSSSSDSSASGSCCYWEATSCVKGQICCDAEGHSYYEDTCKGSNGQKHHCVWENDECIVS